MRAEITKLEKVVADNSLGFWDREGAGDQIAELEWKIGLLQKDQQ